MLRVFIFIVCLFFISAIPVFAIYDPLIVPNNKYGIHIIDENDLLSASFLVNSSGGDWGYVTLVIAENDRKEEKWKEAFRQMRNLHLIPVIRIASTLSADTWTEPGMEEIDNWAFFLNKLPWYTLNRYIIVYNEPNHAKEWGGKIDPKKYSEILIKFSGSLKEQSEDFFILPAGLDASAQNTSITVSENVFLNQMINYRPDFTDYIDGWTSHSYPNPDFSGRVTDQGKGSLKTYVWEINFLKKMGIEKNLPVFITETGWRHNQDNPDDYTGLTPDKIADNILQASRSVWNDNRIVMISPFLLNYQSFPFLNFSWQKYNSGKFYSHFDAYRSILKTRGEPKMVEFKEETKGLQTEIPPVISKTVTFRQRIFYFLDNLFWRNSVKFFKRGK